MKNAVDQEKLRRVVINDDELRMLLLRLVRAFFV